MRALDRFCVFLAVASGVFLILLIGLTFTEVILRYVFLAPILGVKDLLQMGMVVVVSLAVPFTWRIGGHIIVDLVPDFRQPALTAARDVGVRLISAAIFALIAWRAWVRADDAALFNEATNMIELPFRPFFWVLAFASAIQVFVLCVESLWLVRGGPLGFTIDWVTTSEEDAASG